MWSKRLIVNKAFGDLALQGYVFDLTPEEIQDAILSLDAMMASWEAYGIRIGYQTTTDPEEADPDQESGIPDWANKAAYKNLAIDLAASFGKAVPPSLAVSAKIAYDGMLGLIAANPPQMQFKGNLPIGAGWKRNNYNGGPFVMPPVEVLTPGPDGLLDIDGVVPV